MLTSRFDFDAYGVQLSNTPSSVAPATTDLLYSGEQFDPHLAMGYNRARYYDMAAGVWNRVDPFAGNRHDPQSLHKYAYCHGEPVGGVDPTGEFTLLQLVGAIGIMFALVGAFGAAVQTFKRRVLKAVTPAQRRGPLVLEIRLLGQKIAAGSIFEGEAFAQVVESVAAANSKNGQIHNLGFFSDLSSLAVGSAGDNIRRFACGDDDVPNGYSRSGSGLEGWLCDHTEDRSFVGGTGAPGVTGVSGGRVDHFVMNAGNRYLYENLERTGDELSAAFGANAGAGDAAVGFIQYLTIDTHETPTPGGTSDTNWDLWSNAMGRVFAQYMMYNRPSPKEVGAWIRTNLTHP